MNPHPYFLEGELIHLVDKTKNMQLTIGQLPIKFEWWEVPLSLWVFSRSNIHDHSTGI